MSGVIESGAHVALYTNETLKVVKIKAGAVVYYSKKPVKLEGMIGHTYGSKFEVSRDGQCQYVGLVEDDQSSLDSVQDDTKDGEILAPVEDNRNLKPLRENQTLDMGRLKEMAEDESVSGKDIIQALIEGSSTYAGKTAFSQEKWLKRKRAKYMMEIVVLKPSLRIIADSYFNRKGRSILWIRPDTLARILTQANIHAYSRVLTIDQTQRLIVGAVLDKMISSNASIAQQSPSGILFNLHFHPNENIIPYNASENSTIHDFNFRPSDATQIYHNLQLSKIKVIPEFAAFLVQNYHDLVSEVQKSSDEYSALSELPPDTITEEELRISRLRNARVKGKLPRAYREIEELGLFVSQKYTAVIMAARIDAYQSLVSVLPFVHYSSPFVVYSPSMEPLVDLFKKLRESHTYACVNLQITETFTREYQVLYLRTHPTMSTTGNSGYILTGTYIQDITICAPYDPFTSAKSILATFIQSNPYPKDIPLK